MAKALAHADFLYVFVRGIGLVHNAGGPAGGATAAVHILARR